MKVAPGLSNQSRTTREMYVRAETRAEEDSHLCGLLGIEY